MDAQGVARLEAEWARLAGVLSLLLQAVVTIDEADGSATLNEAASRLFALPSGPSPARPVVAALQSLMSDAVNVAEVSRVRARLAEDPNAVVTSSLWSFQEPLRFLRVMTRPVPPSARVWVLDDVTRQTLLMHQVERSLVEAAATAELFRGAIDSLPDPQLQLEPVRDERGEVVDGWFLDVNRAACEQLGLSRGAFLGAGLCDLFPPPAAAPLLALCADVAETTERKSVTDLLFEHGSTRRWYDVGASRVGERVIVNLRDVTARHEALRHLAEAEAALRGSKGQ